MKHKLFANIRRMTNLFCIGILGVTLSALALRLTVFSDMAAAAEKKDSDLLTSEGYQINSRIYFSTVDAKGDVFITNREGNQSIIQVTVTLDGNGDPILATGYISPGGAMDSAKLTPAGQTLAQGVYQCTAEITAHDPASLKTIGSAQETVEIYIGQRPDGTGKDSGKSVAIPSSSTEAEDSSPASKKAEEPVGHAEPGISKNPDPDNESAE